MCLERATDRLLDQLLREHGLCLLSNALTPEEIKPSTIVTLAPFRPADRPVRRPFGDIFEPSFNGAIVRAPFKPIVLAESKGTLAAELVAKAAGVLGDAIGAAEFQAALSSSGARTFDLSLGDARRSDLDVHTVERHLRLARLTNFGRTLHDEGTELYLIHRTVTAAEVVISGGRERANSLATAITNLLDGKSTVSRRGEAQIVMRPLGDNEMVIGFAASKIIEHPDGGYTLRGLTKPLLKLDEDDRLENESAETFSSGSGEPLASVASG